MLKKVIIFGSGPHSRVVLSEIIQLKDYKVIGFIDEKLKKGELRVTVIASGFPEDQVISSNSASSIFNFGGGNKESESSSEQTEAPVAKSETPKEKPSNSSIFNTTSPRPAAQKPTETKQSEQTNDKKDDGDDWSSVPAFLRRNRK